MSMATSRMRVFIPAHSSTAVPKLRDGHARMGRAPCWSPDALLDSLASMAASTLTHLECSRCRRTLAADRLQNLCACGGPLLARYDLARAAQTLTRESLGGRRRDLWRYEEVLPGKVSEAAALGEGGTPLLRLPRLGEQQGCANLYLKDEAFNPTGSFKARGLATGVTMARALGARKLALPTAGNAGGALAAYAARAGLEAYVLMPRDAPRANRLECEAHGAHLILVDGLISECARLLAERKDRESWFDMSTLKEPYRVEGKKTLGYELYEQLGGGGAAARRYPLSHRRRRRPDRDVEGLRRNGRDEVDRPRAPEDDCRTGQRLRAHRPRLRGREERIRALEAGGDSRRRAACAKGPGGFPRARRRAPQPRRRRGGER